MHCRITEVSVELKCFVGNECAVKAIYVGHLWLHSRPPNLANLRKTLDTTAVATWTFISANVYFIV